ncbi:MAG: FAD-linked oxidase C-terminal domain-containing protein [Candidatus Hydrogenedentales bacterium]
MKTLTAAGSKALTTSLVSPTIAALHRAAPCELRTDLHTRQLYATDASIYQITPAAVAFPRDAEEARELIGVAVDAGMPLHFRGAGTGLAGGALGVGLVVDFSRHQRTITDLDRERRTVRVQPGVVLDQLNAFLKPHGLMFGADVATSSRATLGGMIGNNSSGAHVTLFGTTVDNLQSLDVALADGRIVTIGNDDASLSELRSAVDALAQRCAAAIDARMPPGLVKRWPAYGIDRWLRDRADLTRIVCGSEGTLAAIVAAELQLVPLPQCKGLGAVFFASVAEAMQAAVEYADLAPAAIEHIDRALFDQTIGKLTFQRARALLQLDEQPCEAILLIEFFGEATEVDSKLHALHARNLGLRNAVFRNDADMETVWDLRKAGLSLLTSRRGAAKPHPGIEDVAVRPRDLPAYVAALQNTMRGLGLEGSFYGHAAAGLLHVRPVIDLHRAGDIARFRRLAEEVAAITKQYKGSIAGEHGVGIARTEFLEDQLGPDVHAAMVEIKKLFDPKNVLNPGKIISDGRYLFDTHLRQGDGANISLPFKPALAFSFRDQSFVGNLEQCNGNGACRKTPPTMCPTYRATGEEAYSTRGYANTIRAALEGRTEHSGDPLLDPALDTVFSGCLSCKACRTECPSNVNMPLLKAELAHARYEKYGVPSRVRMLSRVDRLGAWGARMPRLANAVANTATATRILERFGLTAKRPLPAFAADSFASWFRQRKRTSAGARGTVVLWDDCFARFYEPGIGRAAVQVLHAAGFAITLSQRNFCCGRPAFSLGRLDLARKWGEGNLRLLAGNDAPILFTEPSCYSMFAEDYRELDLEGAEAVAQRAYLVEDFVGALLETDPAALAFKPGERAVAVHGHCHAKALRGVTPGVELLRRIPGCDVAVLNAGCCGMAGAYGVCIESYERSLQVAEPLAALVNALPHDTVVAAAGTSCRQQIDHVCNQTARHPIELVAQSLHTRGL